MFMIFRSSKNFIGLVTMGLLATGAMGIGADNIRETPVVKAISKTLPSVVNIRTESVVEVRDPFAELFQNFWNPYYRQPQQDIRRSLGSGVVIHG